MAKEDREFILNDGRWPILPVKRWPKNSYSLESGFIVAKSDDKPYIVYDMNMWLLKGGIPISEQVKDAKKYEYKDVDTLLADGWLVD